MHSVILTLAVDYYELDFADKAERWIMQELVHLAIAEPGGLDNLVFTGLLPHALQSNVDLTLHK